jgi:Holliday junction resolvasome RuvABC endonuclease subunit
MRVLAFDQASINAGWSLFDENGYIDSGLITKNKNIPIEQRVPQMAEAICAKIKELKADIVCIEGIQTQSNQRTVIDLARLQGGIMMYCEIKHIPIHILSPSEWRKVLGFHQGPKVPRAELKEQSMNYIKEHLGFDNFSEDRCEACCIGIAANKLYNTK